MNLKTETIEHIRKAGLTPDQIIFIGCKQTGHRCTWEEFLSLANREYDNGYGGNKVAGDLEIIFADGTRLRRGEYDGSEWWETIVPFVPPKEEIPIENLFVTAFGY